MLGRSLGAPHESARVHGTWHGWEGPLKGQRGAAELRLRPRVKPHRVVVRVIRVHTHAPPPQAPNTAQGACDGSGRLLVQCCLHVRRAASFETDGAHSTASWACTRIALAATRAPHAPLHRNAIQFAVISVDATVEGRFAAVGVVRPHSRRASCRRAAEAIYAR